MSKRQSSTRTSQYWLSLTLKGRVWGVGYGYPPHELTANQVEITKEEYFLLKSLAPTDLHTAARLIKALHRKINAHKKHSSFFNREKKQT